MISLIRKLLWFVLFLVSTFCFYVLFEHGYTNFRADAQTEFENLQRVYKSKLQPKKDQSESLIR